MNRDSGEIGLAELLVGESGMVSDVTQGTTVGARLMELGFVPGMTVELLGIAPLGDPLEFELCGYRISLRRSEANCVRVTRVVEIR